MQNSPQDALRQKQTMDWRGLKTIENRQSKIVN